MKKLLSFLFCLAILQFTVFLACSTPESKGPGTVSGKIVAQVDNSPLNDVLVQLVNSDLIDSTNVNGCLFNNRHPPGTFDIIASKAGYQSVTKNKITVKAGENLIINFALPQAP